MFWFFAATHASHYYLTITMQKLPKVPPAAICGVFAALGRRWGYQRGEPPSPTSKIHYDQYNVQHFMPFESRWCFQPTKEYYQTWDFCQKTPQKKSSFFRAAIKKKLIILYSSTVNPIRLHTVINFTFLNFSSIVDASLDNSNLINYIWSESIHELQVCLRRIT